MVFYAEVFLRRSFFTQLAMGKRVFEEEEGGVAKRVRVSVGGAFWCPDDEMFTVQSAATVGTCAGDDTQAGFSAWRERMGVTWR